LPGQIVHLQNESAQPFAEGRQRIFDVRTFCFKTLALHRAVQFQFAKLGGEHLLADAGQRPAQLGVPPRAVKQLTQNQHLPFPANHGQQAFNFAFHAFEIHASGAPKGA